MMSSIQPYSILFLLLLVFQLATPAGGLQQQQQQQQRPFLPDRIPWLIVGGGPHGVTVAARLVAEGVVASPETDLRIVDGGPELLSRWKGRAAASGMQYLRSASKHHLDVPALSLRSFAGPQRPGGKKRRGSDGSPSSAFAGDYHRPSLDLFDAHCAHVVAKYGLQAAHVRGVATGVEPLLTDDDDDSSGTDPPPIRVAVAPVAGSSSSTECLADNVVLALGPPTDNYPFPAWATDELRRAGFVRHIFDNEKGDQAAPPETPPHHHYAKSQGVAVVGGGMTAVQFALATAEATGNKGAAVHLVSRHAVREQQFDVHSDWMMDLEHAAKSEAAGGKGQPRRLRNFHELPRVTTTASTPTNTSTTTTTTTTPTERRAVIARERVRGTLSPAVSRGARGLARAVKSGAVAFHEAVEIVAVRRVAAGVAASSSSGCSDEDNEENEKDGVDGDGDGHQHNSLPGRDVLAVTLSSGEELTVGQVVLATGFGPGLPGSTTCTSVTTGGAMGGATAGEEEEEEEGEGGSGGGGGGSGGGGGEGGLVGELAARCPWLPVAPGCGFPVLDADLRWGGVDHGDHDHHGGGKQQIGRHRLYATGALAELELGPSARNLAGARLAAERIVAAAQRDRGR